MTRGDVYMLDFGVPFGSEPGMRRPVVIIQSDKENLNGRPHWGAGLERKKLN